MAVSKRWDFIFKPWGRSPIPCRFLPKNLLALQCPCRRARARQRKGEMAVFPPLFCETKTGDGLVCSRFFLIIHRDFCFSCHFKSPSFIENNTSKAAKRETQIHSTTSMIQCYSSWWFEWCHDIWEKQLWNSHTIHVWYKYLATFGGFLWFSCR